MTDQNQRVPSPNAPAEITTDELLNLPPGFMVGGTYRVIAKIGIGAMGVVYRAEDVKLKRHVSVKFLNPIIADSPEIVEMFRNEAQALAKVNHPCIVQIYTFGEEQGCLYFVMEYLNGQTLSSVLDTSGRFRPAAAAPILRQIAEALEASHASYMIHRDLKPANVMILPQQRVKVMDFGLAGVAATATGRAVGTPRYMAPEQALGQKVDGRADLYSLGIIAYEMLVGDVPFSADNYRKTLDLHVNAPIPSARQRRPDVPREWDEFIQALLAKRPEERPPSATVVMEQLDRLQNAAAHPGAAEKPKDPKADAERLYQRARANFEIGELAQARALAQDVLARDDKHARSWNLLGAVDLRAGNLENACTAFTKALVIDPNFYEAALNIGTALHKQRRYSEAIWAFERATTLMPGLPAPWASLGESRMACRDFPGARKAWERALDLDSQNAGLKKRLEELKKLMAL